MLGDRRSLSSVDRAILRIVQKDANSRLEAIAEEAGASVATIQRASPTGQTSVLKRLAVMSMYLQILVEAALSTNDKAGLLFSVAFCAV